MLGNDILGCSGIEELGPVCHKLVNWESHMWINWCLRVCPSLVACCRCLCIRSLVPCHWHACYFVLSGLKECGLGTQSLGLDCPLSEVGTSLEQYICYSPHRLIIQACLLVLRTRKHTIRYWLNTNLVTDWLVLLGFDGFWIVYLKSEWFIRIWTDFRLWEWVQNICQ